jgi:capsular exopolysaccharide synthesis family protein
MSRIQNILERAERDGGVRRTRTMTDGTGASVLALDEPGAVVSAPMVDTPAAGAVVAAPPMRTLRASHLDPNLVAALAPGATSAEQYRALRTRVVHADHGAAVDVILVSSPGRGEGKSLTAANLALTMAQDFQSRICIVDANLRHSRIHSLFGVSETPGLAEVLSGQAALSDALIRLEDQQITMLPAGRTPTHPAELLGSIAMRRTIETLRSQFDRVIIDAPSVGPLADVGILAPLVDGVLLVVQAGTTTKPAIQEAVSTIRGGKFLGVVLNGAV